MFAMLAIAVGISYFALGKNQMFITCLEAAPWPALSL